MEEEIKQRILEVFSDRIQRDPRYTTLFEKFGSNPELWEFLNPSIAELLRNGGLTASQTFWLSKAASALAALIENRPVTASALQAPTPTRTPAAAGRRYSLTKEQIAPALAAYIAANGAPNVALRVRGSDVAVGQLMPDGSINIDGVVKTPTAWLNEFGGTGSGNDAWKLLPDGKRLSDWYRELVASGASHRD